MSSSGPYSSVFQAGNHYYISGQIGIDTKTNKAARDIEKQTKQTMTNIEKILSTRNLSISDLVKTTIYLKNMDDFSKVNKIYESFFNPDTPKPARACVEVSKLPNVAETELLIEIEAIAYKE